MAADITVAATASQAAAPGGFFNGENMKLPQCHHCRARRSRVLCQLVGVRASAGRPDRPARPGRNPTSCETLRQPRPAKAWAAPRRRSQDGENGLDLSH